MMKRGKVGLDSLVYCLTALIVLCVNQVSGELCKEYGHYCNAPSKCCGSKCCSDLDYEASMINYYRWNLWNMWYFWFIIIFILMSCFGGCGYYKRRQMLYARQRTAGITLAPPPRSNHRDGRMPVSVAVPVYTHAYAYTGPGAETGAYFMAPPPYSEVVSQPELYPVNKTDLPPYPGANNPTSVPQLNQASSQTSSVIPVPTQTAQRDTTLPPVPSYSEIDNSNSALSARGISGTEAATPAGITAGSQVSGPHTRDQIY